MTEQQKALWAEARRIAGEVEQCTLDLSTTDNCYCILGLLCETYRRSTGRGFWFDTGKGKRAFRLGNARNAHFAPKEVMDAFSLMDQGAAYAAAVNENDSGRWTMPDLVSFMEKAAIVDEITKEENDAS